MTGPPHQEGCLLVQTNKQPSSWGQGRKQAVWRTAFLQMNHYQLFTVSASRQLMRNCSCINPSYSALFPFLCCTTKKAKSGKQKQKTHGNEKQTNKIFPNSGVRPSFSLQQSKTKTDILFLGFSCFMKVSAANWVMNESRKFCHQCVS